MKWLVALPEDIKSRLEKIKNLRSQGKDPYPSKTKYIPFSLEEIIKNPRLDKFVSVAGRVISIRRHGKIGFVDILDDGEKIQLVLRFEILEDRFSWFFEFFDEGDFIEAHGRLFYTKKGELSIEVHDFNLISKSMRELPTKYGRQMANPDTRYRKRHLDILISPEIRAIFDLRFLTIREIREFLWKKGFVEVETPILQPVYGGAAARPFTTKIWAIDETWYLRISPELYLKRYIVAGYPKVFEIGRQFRNEDIDTRHNPEFTTLELYEAYADYNDIMQLTEELIFTVATSVMKRNKIKFPVNGELTDIDLSPPWKKIQFFDALLELGGIDGKNISDDEIKKLLDKYNVKLPGTYVRGIALGKLFDKLIEPKLIQPTIIYNYPRETSPLCKPLTNDSSLIERFEVFIGGMEIANAYTELNDPQLQKKFFEEEQQRYNKGDEEAHPYDWDFVEAIEYGMPPTGGLGIGLDRVIMLLAGTESIKEVIPFPIMKREHAEQCTVTQNAK
ncbi:MAG: lysine--tRNA ligase [Candidatus Korarchaeota archaeon]